MKMNKTYIFGHRNPDTDSICASITLANLKHQLGLEATPVCLGEINNETKYVLDYFKVRKPKYINDVKLQISDLDYRKGFQVLDTECLYDAFTTMNKDEVSGIPVVNENKKLVGMITLKEIATYLIDGDFENIKTNYNNIIKTLEGEEILKFNNEIEGKIRVATYRSTTIRESIDFNKSDILIVADRHSVIEYAVKCGIQLIILVGDACIKEEHLKIAEENKVNIIKTKLSGFFVTKRINLCSYNKSLIETKENEPIYFKEHDYVNDFLAISSRIKHTNYPVVNSNNTCLGMLRVADINYDNKKKVILVDHNEEKQSAIGLDEAEIIEVIDHHNIGSVNTKNPINFRNMAVGSTNTIIYTLYLENNITITKEIAGLMLSGILSDTLLLKSPTTTQMDRDAVKALEEITGLDYMVYGLEMYKAGVDISGKSIDEVIHTDYKTYESGDNVIGISQVMTLSIEEIDNKKDEYIKKLDETITKENLKIATMFVTDIINKGSYLYYNKEAESIVKSAFNLSNIKQGIYLDGYVSRKKQMVPNLLDILK